MNNDSDLEIIPDPDVTVQFSNVTRSIFNITLDLPDDEPNTINENADYEKRLNAEIDEWQSLLKKIKKSVSDPSSVIKNTDYSVLSPDKLAYLKSAPGLTEFVNDSIEFLKEAKVYMEEYSEILEMHENLVEICNNRLDTQKSQLIEKCIFNNP